MTTPGRPPPRAQAPPAGQLAAELVKLPPAERPGGAWTRKNLRELRGASASKPQVRNWVALTRRGCVEAWKSPVCGWRGGLGAGPKGRPRWGPWSRRSECVHEGPGAGKVLPGQLAAWSFSPDPQATEGGPAAQPQVRLGYWPPRDGPPSWATPDLRPWATTLGPGSTPPWPHRRPRAAGAEEGRP